MRNTMHNKSSIFNTASSEIKVLQKGQISESKTQ